jgi:hypothetical protein
MHTILYFSIYKLSEQIYGCTTQNCVTMTVAVDCEYRLCTLATIDNISVNLLTAARLYLCIMEIYSVSRVVEGVSQCA